MGLDVYEKRVGEKFPVGFLLTDRLTSNSNEAISSANVTCSNGLNSSGSPILSNNNMAVSQVVYGGTAGYYSVTFLVTTTGGNILSEYYLVRIVTDALPAAANANRALVSLSEAKLVIGKVTDEDTPFIDILIDAVGSMFDSELGRNLCYANYANECYDGSGRPSLWLRNYPVVGNVTVIENDAALIEGNSNDYVVDRALGRLVRLNTVWYPGPNMVLVSYNAGYNATGNNITLPAGLRLAALKQIAYEYDRYSKKDWAEQSRSHADHSTSVKQAGLIDDVLKELDKYRRFAV